MKLFAVQKIYLNPKLLMSVLLCFILGPVIVPCSVPSQMFWDPVITMDVPFPQGVGMICLVLKSVITGKIFKTLAKTGPACPSLILIQLGLPVLLQQRKIILLLQQMTVLQLSCFFFLNLRFFLHLLIFPILINPASIK